MPSKCRCYNNKRCCMKLSIGEIVWHILLSNLSNLMMHVNILQFFQYQYFVPNIKNSFCQLSILQNNVTCKIVWPCIKGLVVMFCAIEECLVFARRLYLITCLMISCSIIFGFFILHVFMPFSKYVFEVSLMNYNF